MKIQSPKHKNIVLSLSIVTYLPPTLCHYHLCAPPFPPCPQLSFSQEVQGQRSLLVSPEGTCNGSDLLCISPGKGVHSDSFPTGENNGKMINKFTFGPVRCFKTTYEQLKLRLNYLKGQYNKKKLNCHLPSAIMLHL